MLYTESANLPAGATFHADTRTFEWTPGKEQGGVHIVTFTATSGELTSSRDVKITVKGQPVIVPDATVELTAKQAFTYQVLATDPTGEPLVYSVAEMPLGAEFDCIDRHIHMDAGSSGLWQLPSHLYGEQRLLYG